jgi:hypothetical protein
MSIKDRFTVKSIKKKQTHDWLLYKHYAGRIPSISWAFGLFENQLKGVCTFGTPASSTLLRGVCGEKWSDNVIELNRLVISEDCPKNTASYFVSSSIKLLPKPKIIVSYADTSMGHVGKVYQATNFIYTGLSSKFRDPKIRGLEHQHHATYAKGKSNKELREEFGDRLYFEERDRKHRYLYFHGSRNDKRQMESDLNYPIKEYPKGKTKRYDASYKPQVQSELF